MSDDTLSPLAREIYLMPDGVRDRLLERAAIRSESGEDDAAAGAAALEEARAELAARPARGERDAASWDAVAEWRRAGDEGRRRERAELAAWERAQGLGRPT